ncbi:MAG: VanW family protein [Acidimicrobiia bacterium]|nr:MAG: VanW family protein [Acidimicrobiia bacterium]
MNARLRTAGIVAPIGLLLVAVALYLIDVAVHRDTVPRGVIVAGLEIGGDTPSEAALRIEDLERELLDAPLTVRVEGAAAQVAPADLGLSLDVEAIVDEAVAVGRDGSFFEELQRWLASFSNPSEVALVATTDLDAMEAKLRELADDLVGAPPFDGSVRYVDGAVRTEMPRAGLTIDTSTARPPLEAAFLALPHLEVGLSVRATEPRLTPAHVEAASREAERLLAGPVTLTVPTAETPGDEAEPEEDGEDEVAEEEALPRLTEFTYSVDDLGAALVVAIVPEGEGFRMDVDLDPTILAERVLPFSDQLAVPPVDAQFEFDEEAYLVSVIPSEVGQRIDVTALLPVVEAAIGSASRTAPLPLIDGAEPEVTTEDLEALDIRHMVSSFTTYHACCEARVTNIQTMADAVDGTLVLPGEEFSLNEVVGQRTEEKGYLPAGTIVAGILEDTVGGGVSQFSTTIYNAVFWGGYEDVFHIPHSYYFSRYPEGIEATLNWPDLHNIWRNDSESAVMVRTRYTRTSITVELWGNNDGRVLWGDHWRGVTEIDIRAEGGPNARVVRSEVSEREDEKEPQPQYFPDELVKPGPGIIDDEGGVGWTVEVQRWITQGDEETRNRWTVRYAYRPILTRVNPCMLDPEDDQVLLPEEEWVLVCPENLAPLVTLSGPTSATVGTPILLEAIAIDDWDEQVTYLWTGADAFTAPTAALTEATFNAAGTYDVVVTATDLDGNPAEATIQVVVSDP